MASPENIVPEEKLPQCWSDDVRMNALFAPFRLKSANPESWEMKMKFWSDMLRQWCRCKNDPLVSATDAKVAFMRRGRTPACIDIVVEELLRYGDLVPMSKYQQALRDGPEGWVRWGARLAFKPAAIAATAITSLLPVRQAVDGDGLPKASIDSTQRFVLESAVKEQAADLLKDYPAGAERLGTVEDLMLYSNYPSAKRECFEILLGHLVTQGLAVRKGEIVKLSETTSKVSPVTEQDEALHRLLSAEKKILNDSEKFHRDSERALEDARVAMKLGNKIAAKNHLRRKHKSLERANGCDAALENVRHLLHNMRQMEVNATVVNTYKMSTQAMKRGLQDGGLTEDAAHDTIDELKEVLETYNEVERTLAGSVDDLDMQELEQELSDLLAGPGPSGGIPGKEQRTPASRGKTGKQMDREFVFDGEERMMAELNDLSVEDKDKPRREKKKVAVAVGEWARTKHNKEQPKSKDRPSQLWYPPQEEFLTEKHNPWELDHENNLDRTHDELCNSFNMIKLDDRLHPGQRLDLDLGSLPGVYGTDFLVQDHNVQDKVWLYNKNDQNQNQNPTGLDNSTEYYSAESPGKSSGNFQMAPGGERSNTHMSWPQDKTVLDLEERLKNLRGFNL